jgi:hypothetical protein
MQATSSFVDSAPEKMQGAMNFNFGFSFSAVGSMLTSTIISF